MPDSDAEMDISVKEVKTEIRQSFVYPNDKDIILEVLRKTAERASKDRIVFRSATSEFQTGAIKFDEKGRPQIPDGEIASQAFSTKGWEKVQEVVEQSDSIDVLVSRSDLGEIKSPIIWTSETPTTALAFGPASEIIEDQVFMIIQLDPLREVFHVTSFSELEQGITGEQDEEFLQAVENRRLFIIERPPEEISSDIYGESEFTWSETLVGPSIQENEIITLIRVKQEAVDEFFQTVGQVFGIQE